MAQRTTRRSRRILTLVAAGAMLAAACNPGIDAPKADPATVPSIHLYTVVERFNQGALEHVLTTVDSRNPAQPLASVVLDRPIYSLDADPRTGRLLGMDEDEVVEVDPVTGHTTVLYGVPRKDPSTPFAPSRTKLVSIEVNPVTGTVQTLSSGGRVARSGGAERTLPSPSRLGSTDSHLEIMALAHSDNRAGETSSTLYGINAYGRSLVRFTSPGQGTFEEFPSFGAIVGDSWTGPNANSEAPISFDIAPDDTALVSFTRSEQQVAFLYRMDLRTGRIESIGALPAGFQAFAVAPLPGVHLGPVADGPRPVATAVEGGVVEVPVTRTGDVSSPAEVIVALTGGVADVPTPDRP